jgi:hypothetical protein
MGMVMVTLVVVMMVMMTVFDGSVKKNAETLLVTHYLVRSLVKECMFISGTENKGQIHKIKTGNKSLNCKLQTFGNDNNKSQWHV